MPTAVRRKWLPCRDRRASRSTRLAASWTTRRRGPATSASSRAGACGSSRRPSASPWAPLAASSAWAPRASTRCSTSAPPPSAWSWSSWSS
eukprot:11257894-Alexandrium_andersonii.AAC.1